MTRRFNLRARFLAVAAFALALFVVLTIFVLAGRTMPFDERMLAALRQTGAPGQANWPAWAIAATRTVTILGNWPVRLALALVAAIVLMPRGRAREAAVLLISCTAGALLLPVMKNLFARVRPDAAWQLVQVANPSFPSGHALGAAILYPLAGFMLGRVARGLRGGWYGLTTGTAVALAIGATRFVLGVHWVSDVVGGWLLGAAWVSASLALVVRGQRHDGAV